MEKAAPSPLGFQARPSNLRLVGVFTGALICIACFLSLFSVPLLLSLLALLSGSLIFTLASRGYTPPPRRSWQATLVTLGGLGVIIVVMLPVGKRTTDSGEPHPVTYGPAWIV